MPYAFLRCKVSCLKDRRGDFLLILYVMNTPEIIKEAARNLRKNMTESEKIIWNILRKKELWEKFLRQKPIFLFEENNGLLRYIIPDFVSLEKKLIIEVDGWIHKKEDIYFLDREKEKFLTQKWFTVVRVTNEEISSDLENVVSKIKEFMK